MGIVNNKYNLLLIHKKQKVNDNNYHLLFVFPMLYYYWLKIIAANNFDGVINIGKNDGT